MTSKNSARVALVTGGNRGIGVEVCRQLARRGVQVYLGSRDFEAGRKASAQLAGEGLEGITSIQLDVTDPRSLELCEHTIRDQVGFLDILVNNAGVFQDYDHERWSSILTTDLAPIRDTFEINTLGPLRMIQLFSELLKRSQSGGRVINVSSGMGQLSDMNGGYPSYRISKTALNAVTRIASQELAEANIAINAVCPGWVKTDMGGAGAEREPAEGADTIVWLALEAPQKDTGGFYRDREPISW